MTTFERYMQLDLLRKCMCTVTIQMFALLLPFRFWNDNFNALINSIK
jgi:hypothetical protein